MRGLRVFVTVTVTLVWGALQAASLFDPHFQANASATTVMVLVVTWLLATEARRVVSGKNADDDIEGS